MSFNSFNLTAGPVKAASNILLDKVEIVFIPNSQQALGFVTIIDIDLKGKHKGKNQYWGLLPADTIDQDVIDIALYGGKWEKHTHVVAFTHHFNK